MSRGRPLEPSQRIIERELQAYAAYAFTKGYPIACLPSIYPRTNHMSRYVHTSCDLRKKRLSHFLSFQHHYGSSCKKVRFSNTNRFGDITFWRYNLLHTHDHLQTSQQISAPVSTTKRARVPATSVSTVYSTSFTGSNRWGLGIAARTGGESASVSRPETQIWLVFFRHQPRPEIWWLYGLIWCKIPLMIILSYLAGWWLSPTPLKNHGVKVSWDDDIPNWIESHKIHVRTHQPEILTHTHTSAYGLSVVQMWFCVCVCATSLQYICFKTTEYKYSPSVEHQTCNG